ncbi:hypothetical protein C8J57DRAFT_1256524 [Mycena rebaudengoi]|nr:hypothetical protein C8J57DRAFT_1256524 [Mycena rebaudengoi]
MDLPCRGSWEAWITLSEAPGSWTANDEDTAVPSSSEVWAKARAVLHMPFDANKPVITAAPCAECLSMRQMELSDAVREGLVEPSASDTPEKLYDWDGVVFAID